MTGTAHLYTRSNSVMDNIVFHLQKVRAKCTDSDIVTMVEGRASHEWVFGTMWSNISNVQECQRKSMEQKIRNK